MRYTLIAVVLALAAPSFARAEGTRFYFNAGGSYNNYYYSARHSGYYRPATYVPYGYSYYQPYYPIDARYVLPRVYSPYRYGDYKSNYYRNYSYRRSLYNYDHDYRRGLYNYDRGYYYGPAVQRYHRDARDYPSYHFDRREHYNRGTDRSYRDRGDRYRN